MSQTGYNLFCPISKASEFLEPRWTLLILHEMWAGSARFNDIGRGVPGLSPSLLSRRLKEMEGRGLIERRRDGETGNVLYYTTEMARKLEPIVRALGEWAHENIECDVRPGEYDSKLLMWTLRRKIDLTRFPPKRSVIQFIFPDQRPENRNYWLIAKPGTSVDLCLTDPGFEADLFVESDLKTLTDVYMGRAGWREVINSGDVFLSGDEALAASIHDWMRLSAFAV